jgi:hypothetical protein
MTPPLPEYLNREIPELKLNVELNIQIIRSYLRLRYRRSLESYFQKEKKSLHAMPRNRNYSTNFADDLLKNSDLLNLAAKRLYFQDHRTRILPKFTLVCPQIHRGRI